MLKNKNLYIFASLVALLFIASATAAHAAPGVRVDGHFYDEELYRNIEQPIAFDHSVHVKENGMSCEYCHSQARRSTSSGIPPVRTCMGCHVAIKGSTEAQKKEIAKIEGYWERKEEIPWKKIHDLPDHVYFSHQRHLSVGFDCTTCHGEVSEVKQPVPQFKYNEIPLSMGWCMECHRTPHPVDADGKIVMPVRETRGGKIISEAKPTVGAIKGPVDCLVCHK